MAPRNLQVNDAILAFEAASEKRPPRGYVERPIPVADIRPFLSWIETDRDARRRMHRLCKRINRMYLESLQTHRSFKLYLKDLPTKKPYTNMKLNGELNWLNVQAARYGLQPEMIQWQLQAL